MVDFKTKTQIEKGWSDDKKYCVTTSDDKKYLLRISAIEKKERKAVEFEMMKCVEALGVPMCKPVEFGTCEDGVYSLQSWIEGKDLEEEMLAFEDTKQYDYGMEAGRILKQIHTIAAPDTLAEWELRFNCKIERKIQMYQDCPIKHHKGQQFIDYINTNRYLLKDRPQCYQHGDYHVGNMMLDYEGKLQIIDFDRDDFGDPWEEFNRIVWSAQKSPLFASGMVDGYFDGKVPMDFWRLLALYISTNTLSSIPWAISFGQGEIDTMMNQAGEVLEWYDDMRNPVPTWYQDCGKTEYIMNLNPSQLSMIKAGQKKIELRLYDEKRRGILADSIIRFINTIDSTDTLLTRVIEVYVFDTFADLYKELPLMECGYSEMNIHKASPTDMEKYYSIEDQLRYKVVGIRIEVL